MVFNLPSTFTRPLIPRETRENNRNFKRNTPFKQALILSDAIENLGRLRLLKVFFNLAEDKVVVEISFPNKIRSGTPGFFRKSLSLPRELVKK